MPHVIIKLQSGRSAAQKTIIAQEVTKALVAIAGCAEDAVSVSIEDVDPSDWVETVFKRTSWASPARFTNNPDTIRFVKEKP